MKKTRSALNHQFQKIALLNRVKIITMTIYHNQYDPVNSNNKNFTILLSLLYHSKAIKQESENDQNP
jgi:hypothetical protein